MKTNTKNIIIAVCNSLTDDLRRSKYQGAPNKFAGHCYVASEAIYHLLGGKRNGYKPMFMWQENEPHWFIKHSSGKIIDVTASQFRRKIDYSSAYGKGFLTRRPSKRAQIIIKKLKIA